MLLRSSGPKTHAGSSFLLLRKRFGFDRFEDIFMLRADPPPLVIEAQPAIEPVPNLCGSPSLPRI